jgi:type I restriction enzyme S subunit
MINEWANAKLEDVLDYIQPTNYIVSSTEYSNEYKTPVLTAGKSFIIGYTNEENGIFDRLPTIIFDDFTTSIQFVNFKFKVKSSAMKILVSTSSLVDIRYVFYLMKTLRVNTDTHKRFWISIFSQLPIKIASSSEQKVIAEKIEELFSDLDNAIENLKKAQEQLKVYRKAVLKKVFIGKWNKVPLQNISEAVGGCAFKSSSFKEQGVYQVIRIGNVRPGLIRLNVSPIFLDSIDEKTTSKYLLIPGDVIISLTGTRKKRDYGYTAVVKERHLLLNQRLAYLRFNETCLPEFFLYYSWTESFKDSFFASETGNVGQGNVGMKAIQSTEIPLPSIQEQKQIVQSIESRFSVCDMLEESIDENLQKAEALRQSILKEAFEGNMTEQWRKKHKDLISGENSAESLLKKIKAEKEVFAS